MPPAMQRKAFKDRFLNIAMAGGLLVFLMVLCEIVLRSWFPIYLTGYIGFYQYDKDLGFRLLDDVHALKTTDYQQEILTNPLGTVNFQKDFAGYQIKVFAIGDSFTQGTGLPADASYPFQVDLLLNMDHDRYLKKYAVVNLGLAALGAKQNLIVLKRYARKLGKPDFILYLGSGNDYEDDLLFDSGYSFKHMVWGNPFWGGSVGPLLWLTNNIEIGKRVKILVGELRRQRIFAADKKYAQNEGPGQKKCVAELEAPTLQELVKTAGDYDAKLIVSWSDGPKNRDGSYQWLQEFARRNGVAFADWHPAVVSIKQDIPSLPIVNHHSGGHFRTWVNSMIARAYVQQILSSR